MKLFRGFRGKYFSLAAILACSVSVGLEAQAVSIEAKDNEAAIQKASEKESETDEAVAIGAIEIIAAIETKKEYEQSSSRTLKHKSLTTDNIQILTSKEIEIKGFNSISEALNGVAGISYMANGGAGQSGAMFIRGFNSAHTLVLIDGVRLNDASGVAGAQMELLDMYGIDRIEVARGAQSGVWGSDAGAGVVNIITKKNEDGFSADILSEFGSNSWQKYAGEISYSDSFFDISSAFSFIETKGISSSAPAKNDAKYGSDGGYEKDGFRNRSFYIKGGVNITGKDRLEFFMRQAKSKIHFDAGAGIDAKDYDDIYGFGLDEYFNTARSTLYSLGYKGLYDKHKIELRANISDFRRSFYGGYKGKTYEIYASDEWHYENNGSLLFGVGYLKDKVELAAGSKLPKNSQDDRYVFASNSNRFWSLIFTQDMRFDARDTFEDKFTYKIGAKYNFYKDIYFSAAYKSGYLAPNLYQQNYGATQNLEAEESYGYELTLGGEHFSLTYFDQKIKNAIEYSGIYPDDFYYNIDGKSKFHGLEANVNYLFYNFLGEFSYTYLSAKDMNGKMLARRPKDKITASLSYFLGSDFIMNLRGLYIGERHDANKVQTGKYFVADYTVNYGVNDNLNIYFKVNNIFDKYYQEVDGYGTYGRSFYAGFKGSF